MHCRNCGREIFPDEIKCSNCGAPIPNEGHSFRKDNVESNKKKTLIMLLEILCIVYVLCFILMQVQMGVYTYAHWWGTPHAPTIDFTIKINILYAINTILLILCIVGLFRRTLLSWWYFLMSSIFSFGWQIYILSNKNIVMFLGGGLLYPVMVLEICICILLLIDCPIFIEKRKSARK